MNLARRLYPIVILLVATGNGSAQPKEGDGKDKPKVPKFYTYSSSGNEKETFGPTGFDSPKDVEQMLTKRKIPFAKLGDESAKAREITVTGVITIRKGDKLGFMPIRQHHMAVEHWFLSGVKLDDVKASCKDDAHCFVKLTGKARLVQKAGPFMEGEEERPDRWWTIFEPTGSSGGGLEHGHEWGGPNGGVRGYHERVFEFAVEKIHWAKSTKEFDELLAKLSKSSSEVRAQVDKNDWNGALTAVDTMVELIAETGRNGYEVRGLRAFFKTMAALHKDPKQWTDDDARQIVAGFETDWPYTLEDYGKAAYLRTIPEWPQQARERIAKQFMDGWKDKSFRSNRETLCKLLNVLGGKESQQFLESLSAAESRLKKARKELDQAIKNHDYAGVAKTIKDASDDQELVRGFEFAETNIRWIQACNDRCVKLQEELKEPKKRMAALKDEIKKVAAGEWTGNQFSIDGELADYFLPALTDDEKKEVEQWLIARGKELKSDEQWMSHLVVARLLVAVGGKDALDLMPKLIAERDKAPDWQKERLKAWHEALKKRNDERK